jgi:hypothetical protein
LILALQKNQKPEEEPEFVICVYIYGRTGSWPMLLSCFGKNTQDEKGKESSHLKQNKTKQKRTNQQKEEEEKKTLINDQCPYMRPYTRERADEILLTFILHPDLIRNEKKEREK